MLTFRRAVLAPLVALSIALFAVPAASAAWGDLDPTFGGTGSINTLPGDGYGTLYDSAQQADGKILLAGAGGPDFFNANGMLQRLLVDGTPDPGFGSGGTLLLTSPAALEKHEIRAISLQSDGKIVGIAADGDDGVLFRVTDAGALDTTFASPNGYLSFANEVLHDVTVGPAGEIFVGSKTASNDVVLRRFTQSGAQVGAFVSNSAPALASTTFYGTPYDGLSLTPSESGLFMATTSEVMSTAVLFAAKFDLAGNLVTDWGTNGKTTVEFASGVSAEDVVRQSSGAIVIGGTTETMGDNAWHLARLDANGNLDPSFAGGGKIDINPTPGGDGLSALANSPDGGLVAVGSIDDLATDNSIPAIRAMSADGAPHADFGPDGMRYVPLPGAGGFESTFVQPDGRIVAAGSVQLDSNNERVPAVARLQANPVIPVSAPVLSAKVTSPKGKSIAAKKLKKFAGTAATTSGSVTKVEIALQRTDKKLLKKSKRCLWLSSNRAKFKKVKASKSEKCSKPKWLKASGTVKWSYKLKKKLPKGSYVLQVRVTGGGATTVFATARKFRVK